MAEENKNEDFEDSFDDDFAFLEEDEIKAEPNAKASPAVKEAPAQSPFPIKQIAIIGGIIVIGIFIFNTLHKKPPKDTTITTAKEQKGQAAKDPTKAEPTVTIQVQPQKSEIAQTNTPNTETSISHPATEISDNTQAKATDNASKPEPAKLTTAGGEEKSRAEMADLFASNVPEQTNNLETALAQQGAQSQDKEKNKGSKQNSSANMDLYFGNSSLNNKLNKKSGPKEQEISQQTAQLQQTVESITQEMTENVNQLKQLETKINDLSTVIAKVNQNIGTMDARMLGLTEAVDSITQDVSNVKKVIAEEDLDVTSNSSKTTADAQLTYKPPGYSIHAIIPGRAWLKSSSGQIITIAEGDVIGDYGTVAVIDAANNIVRTSSGVSFR